MRKRTRYSLLTMLILMAAFVVAVVLRGKAPPEVARLLPESDAIVYLHLKPLRTATHFDRSQVNRAPDYQKFVDATGIVFERDLDSVAFALHRMPDPNGPNGPVAYSEVFEGRFDGKRLTDYLKSIATSREQYAGHEIFTIPMEGRTLRVAMLGYDTVAASNMPTTEQIHSMLDRHSSAASPFAGSSLLDARYSDVPLLSIAWGIGHIALPFSESGKVSVLGLQLPLPEDTTFVASARYLGTVHVRVEEFSPSEADAARSAQSLGGLLTLLQGIQGAQGGVAGGDAALAGFIQSLKIEQHDERVVLTGKLPAEALKRLSASEASTK